MAIGSGLASSVGVVPETTYATPVAVTRFHEFNKEDMKKSKQIVQGGGLAAGLFAQRASRRIVATQAASGSIETEVVNKGMGYLLNATFGGTVVPAQQGATAAYLQTHPLTDNFGKSLTLQEGVPDTTGTVRAQTFYGCKITSVEFACQLNELLTANFEIDSQKYSEVESLAAPSFLANTRPFHFGQLNVKLGATSGGESTVSGVKGVSLKLERGQAVERYYAGANGLKAEPITNDWVAVTGSITADYLDKTVFHDRFTNDTQTALVFEWVGPLIASTFYETFRLKVPAVFFDSDTPVIDGPDIVSGDFGFTAQLDGTNPLVTAEYITTDVSL